MKFYTKFIVVTHFILTLLPDFLPLHLDLCFETCRTYPK